MGSHIEENNLNLHQSNNNFLIPQVENHLHNNNTDAEVGIQKRVFNDPSILKAVDEQTNMIKRMAELENYLVYIHNRRIRKPIQLKGDLAYQASLLGSEVFIAKTKLSTEKLRIRNFERRIEYFEENKVKTKEKVEKVTQKFYVKKVRVIEEIRLSIEELSHITNNIDAKNNAISKKLQLPFRLLGKRNLRRQTKKNLKVKENIQHVIEQLEEIMGNIINQEFRSKELAKTHVPKKRDEYCLRHCLYED